MAMAALWRQRLHCKGAAVAGMARAVQGKPMLLFVDGAADK
jgi:hypothetical protein